MGPILQFIRPFDGFDTATLIILDEAYDKALASLDDRGQPNIVREVIAVRTCGERRAIHRPLVQRRSRAYWGVGSQQ